MFLSEWREFPSAPCLAGKKILMTARVSMLKLRASLTCFRACFLPGRAKDISAPCYWHSANYQRYFVQVDNHAKCEIWECSNAILKKRQVFWDVTSCWLVNSYRTSGGSWCAIMRVMQSKNVNASPWKTRSFETTVTTSSQGVTSQKVWIFHRPSCYANMVKNAHSGDKSITASTQNKQT
jgi:hypothetical protein